MIHIVIIEAVVLNTGTYGTFFHVIHDVKRRNIILKYRTTVHCSCVPVQSSSSCMVKEGILITGKFIVGEYYHFKS